MSFDYIKDQFHHTKIDFLKVYIDFSEYAFFQSVLKRNVDPVTPICHILVEIHSGEGFDGKAFNDLFSLIESSNYLLYAQEILYCPDAPCSEYSFIHKSCLQEYGLEKEDRLHWHFKHEKTIWSNFDFLIVWFLN